MDEAQESKEKMTSSADCESLAAEQIKFLNRKAGHCIIESCL